MRRLLILLVLWPVVGWGASITNIASGLFTNAAIWQGGVLPTVADVAVVTGYTVTVDSSILVSGLWHVAGTVNYTNNPNIEIKGAGAIKTAGTLNGSATLIATQQTTGVRQNTGWNYPNLVVGGSGVTVFLTNGATIVTSNITVNGGTINNGAYNNWQHIITQSNCNITVLSSTYWLNFRDTWFIVTTNSPVYWPAPNQFLVNAGCGGLTWHWTGTVAQATVYCTNGFWNPYDASPYTGSSLGWPSFENINFVTTELKGLRAPYFWNSTVICTNGWLYGYLAGGDARGLNCTGSVWSNTDFAGSATQGFIFPTNAITDRCQLWNTRNGNIGATVGGVWSGSVVNASNSQTFAGNILVSAATIAGALINQGSGTATFYTQGYQLTASTITNIGTIQASNSTIVVEQSLINTGSGFINLTNATVQFTVSTNAAVANALTYSNIVMTQAGKTLTLTNAATRILGQWQMVGNALLPLTIKPTSGTLTNNITGNNNYTAFAAMNGLYFTNGLMNLNQITVPSTNTGRYILAPNERQQ